MSQAPEHADDVTAGDVTAGDVTAGDEDVLVLDEFALAVWEPTGHVRVDAALGRLADLADADLASHAAVFTDVHRELRQVLADLDG